jgi:hypothetical protein
MAKSVSNEVIVSALLQSGTIKEAAQAVGLTPRAIYDRMADDREFRAQYAEAKTALVRKAVFSINEKLAAAIEAVCDIMTNEDVNPAVRLQAAQTIINNAAKFSSRLDADEWHAIQEGQDTDPLDF